MKLKASQMFNIKFSDNVRANKIFFSLIVDKKRDMLISTNDIFNFNKWHILSCVGNWQQPVRHLISDERQRIIIQISNICVLGMYFKNKIIFHKIHALKIPLANAR